MEGSRSWRSVPTERYLCYVDICSQGLQLCVAHTQRCEDCSGYSHDCFSIYQHPNCTYFCMMTWKENEENQLNARKTTGDAWRIAVIIQTILLAACLLFYLYGKRERLKNLASLFRQHVCKRLCLNSIPPRQNNPDGIEDNQAGGEETEQSLLRPHMGRKKTGTNPGIRNNQTMNHPDTGSTIEASSLLNDGETTPTEQNRNDTAYDLSSLPICSVGREKDTVVRKKIAVSHQQHDPLSRVSSENDDRESLDNTLNAEDNGLSDTDPKRLCGDCDTRFQVSNKNTTRVTGSHHQDRAQTPTRHGSRQRDADLGHDNSMTCRKMVAPSRKNQFRNGTHLQGPSNSNQILQCTRQHQENNRHSRFLSAELPSNASSHSGPHAILHSSSPLDSGYPRSTSYN